MGIYIVGWSHPIRQLPQRWTLEIVPDAPGHLIQQSGCSKTVGNALSGATCL